MSDQQIPMRVEDLGPFVKTTLENVGGEFHVQVSPVHIIVRWDGAEPAPCGVAVDFEARSVRFVWDTGEKP